MKDLYVRACQALGEGTKQSVIVGCRHCWLQEEEKVVGGKTEKSYKNIGHRHTFYNKEF